MADDTGGFSLAPPDTGGFSLTPKAEPAGAARNFASGANEAIAGMAGTPVDVLAGMARNGPGALGDQDLERMLTTRGEDGLTYAERHPDATRFMRDFQGSLEHPFGGSESVKAGLRKLGIASDEVQPQTEGERLARSAGAGAAAAATAPFGLGGLRSYIGSVLTGAGMGLTGEAAEEAAPEALKPTANVAGQLAGGLGIATAYQAGSALLHAVGDRLGRFIAPLTGAGPERLAGERLATAASDPEAARAALANESEPRVPGSAPTTFQAAGDTGLGQLERAAATERPQGFLDRRGEQNAARVAAIDTLAPTAARAGAAGEYFTRQLAAIDEATDQVLGQARSHAEDTLSAIGGEAPGEEGTALQGYGERLRSLVAGARDAARKREGGLWQAVDPEGTLTVGTAPVRQSADEIAGGVSKLARPLAGEEKAIIEAAQGLGPVESFADIAKLRSRLTDAMRTELMQNGRSEAYGRLSRLLQGVHGALEAEVDQQASQDAKAVASGQIAPEDALLQRLAAEAQARYAERNAGAPSALANLAGRAPGAGTGPLPGTGPGLAGGRDGAQLPFQGGSAGAARDQGVAAAPSFDDAARQRYDAARASTRERVETFDQGPAGRVLARGPAANDYRLAESRVAAQFFNAGKTQAEDVSAFLAAAGNDRDRAGELLQDYAAFDLRRAAQRTDGTLDPAKYRRWLAAHQDALSAFPEAAQRFADAAQAQQTLDAATEAKAAALKQYQQGAAGHFLGADPVKAVASALGSENPQATFAELAHLTRADPDARAGLQRAVVDYIRDRLVSNTEAGDTGTRLIKADQFQTFVKRNAKALAQIFSPEQIRAMQAIAEDLQRANRSIAGSKLPGGSNTPQDLAQVAKYGGKLSVLARIVSAAAGAAAGHMVGGLHGALTGAVLGERAGLVPALRAAGIARVGDLVSEAMLNPELAHRLMAQQSARMPEPFARALERQLRALPVATAARMAGIRGDTATQ